MPKEDVEKLWKMVQLRNGDLPEGIDGDGANFGKKLEEEFKKELRKIHHDCEIKLESSIQQPEKEIKALRHELDDLRREYMTEKMKWENKLEEAVLGKIK